MIYFFVGENSLLVEREIARISDAFSGETRKIDAETLTTNDLPDILQGQSLFSEQRLIIIKNLSDNKTVWENLPDFIDGMSDDVTLILAEAKPDKRTKTYKHLKKVAETREFPAWGPRGASIAVDFAISEAKKQGFTLASNQARHLIGRTGYDAWTIFHAVEKLALADEISNDTIDELIEARPEENVFLLLETALSGDAERVHAMLENLALENDAFQTFGLLSSQIMQLAALTLSQKSPQELATAIGAHPYALSKMVGRAARLSGGDAKTYVRYAAETDHQLKSTGHDPWLLIETLLQKIARH